MPLNDLKSGVELKRENGTLLSGLDFIAHKLLYVREGSGKGYGY
jgi:hypothetical protein